MVDKGLICDGPRKVFLQAYGFINPAYQGLGLFRKLSLLTEVLALENGFDYMISENTTPGTKNLYHTLPGYLIGYELAFQDISLPGTYEKGDMAMIDKAFYLKSNTKLSIEYVAKKITKENVDYRILDKLISS